MENWAVDNDEESQSQPGEYDLNRSGQSKQPYHKVTAIAIVFTKGAFFLSIEKDHDRCLPKRLDSPEFGRIDRRLLLFCRSLSYQR